MMKPVSDTPNRITIGILGGTGRFGEPYIRELLARRMAVRILARTPGHVVARFPGADVRRGSMLVVDDVCRTLDGAAGGLLISPVGGNDDTAIELAAARVATAAARRVRLPHLIYVSLIQPSYPTGIPLLDVKRDVEHLIASSGIPWSSLRTGCYMDAWLAFFPFFMKLGFYLFPIRTRHHFSFTSDPDVARVVFHLIQHNQVLNRPVDVIEPRARTVQDVAHVHQKATGRRLLLLGAWILPVLKILRPVVFRWAFPTGASRVRLLSYFDRHDWIGNPGQIGEVLPGFKPVSMEDHMRARCRCFYPVGK
jgi:uncharacterized protein YbjT (DUF2867 family)